MAEIRSLCFQDSIDRLPDELLISIVSRLPVIEAGRTSILARRWRYFWMFNLVLIFDGSHVLRALEKSGKPLKTERIKFMKGVNRILKLHSSTTIEEFRIVFDLDERYARVIKQWLIFAFAKSVRRLELDLAISYTGVLHDQRYIFPNVCQRMECLQIFPLGLSSCESLVTVSLREVDVTGEVLEFFLSNCPFLEELCVRDSGHLKNLRTSCPSIRLRQLEIVNCMAFRSLDICTPNLRSFTFYGLRITMALKNVSSLSSLSLGAELSSIVTLNLIEISRCLSHLETLRLHTPAVSEYEKLPEYLYLPRLKKLILDVCAYGFESLLCYTPLINGAPLLHEIVLKLTLCETSNERRTIYPAKGRQHQCLEVLRIEGFSGTKTDVELAQYVVDNSVNLKKIVIGFCPPSVSRHAGAMGLRQREMAAVEQVDVLGIAQMTMAREGISLVKARLPADVQLIII
ncbi:hypothetical protein C2S53_014155 [Perilla frutescens var. hirtella]|uniref:F-box domain-containing protein n=1 Tax=Perilla frutescens var. hirtella TaxID=608512 RepID=A0AAD4J822_PERFH|nr:hypothetical protein C2S53_014155 [Perilla frutescens var. hirtella]